MAYARSFERDMLQRDLASGSGLGEGRGAGPAPSGRGAPAESLGPPRIRSHESSQYVGFLEQQIQQIGAAQVGLRQLSDRCDSLGATLGLHEDRLLNQARLLNLTQEAIDQQAAKTGKALAALRDLIAALDAKLPVNDPKINNLLDFSYRVNDSLPAILAIPGKQRELEEAISAGAQEARDAKARLADLLSYSERLAKADEVEKSLVSERAITASKVEGLHKEIADRSAELSASIRALRQQLEADTADLVERQHQATLKECAAVSEQACMELRRDLLRKGELSRVVMDEVGVVLSDALRGVIGASQGGALRDSVRESLRDSAGELARDFAQDRARDAARDPPPSAVSAFVSLLLDHVASRIIPAATDKVVQLIMGRVEQALQAALRESSRQVGEAKESVLLSMQAVEATANRSLSEAVAAQAKAEEALGSISRVDAATRDVVGDLSVMAAAVDSLMNESRGVAVGGRVPPAEVGIFGPHAEHIREELYADGTDFWGRAPRRAPSAPSAQGAVGPAAAAGPAAQRGGAARQTPMRRLAQDMQLYTTFTQRPQYIPISIPVRGSRGEARGRASSSPLDSAVDMRESVGNSTQDGCADRTGAEAARGAGGRPSSPLETRIDGILAESIRARAVAEAGGRGAAESGSEAPDSLDLRDASGAPGASGEPEEPSESLPADSRLTESELSRSLRPRQVRGARDSRPRDPSGSASSLAADGKPLPSDLTKKVLESLRTDLSRAQRKRTGGEAAEALRPQKGGQILPKAQARPASPRRRGGQGRKPDQKPDARADAKAGAKPEGRPGK